MSHVVADAMAWLRGQREQFVSDVVTYKRGTQEFTFNASSSETEWELDDTTEGFKRFGEAFSFLIPLTEFRGQFGKPEAGDVLEDDQEGVKYTYEVAAPGGAPVYEIVSHRQFYKVHTILVTTAAT